MNGLILKDLYALWSYMRAFFLLDLVMILSARFSHGNTFLLFYPCILSGMLSMTLISYEEKEKWNEYAMTLPFSRAQLVSSKYILSLMLTLITVAVILLVQLTRPEGASGLPGMLYTLLPLSLLPTAVLLPFIYKFGSEKGRLTYYMVLGGVCGLLALASNMQAVSGNDPFVLIQNPAIGAGLLGICAAVYALSWYLSIRFYQKRAF